MSPALFNCLHPFGSSSRASADRLSPQTTRVFRSRKRHGFSNLQPYSESFGQLRHGQALTYPYRRTGSVTRMLPTHWTAARPFTWCRRRSGTRASQPPDAISMRGRKTARAVFCRCSVLKPNDFRTLQPFERVPCVHDQLRLLHQRSVVRRSVICNDHYTIRFSSYVRRR